MMVGFAKSFMQLQAERSCSLAIEFFTSNACNKNGVVSKFQIAVFLTTLLVLRSLSTS